MATVCQTELVDFETMDGIHVVQQIQAENRDKTPGQRGPKLKKEALDMQNEHVPQKHPRGSSPQQDMLGSPFTDCFIDYQREQRLHWEVPALGTNSQKIGTKEENAA